MENAEAYLKAGGIARWDFIVFKHNEHQVEQAEALAKKMGFKQFRIRKTSRFDYSPDGPDKWRVKNKNGEIEYYLEPPGEKYRNPQSKKFQELTEQYGTIEKYYDVAPIECLYKNEFRRIYVNAYAQVFPCCYLANKYYRIAQQKWDMKFVLLDTFWGATLYALVSYFTLSLLK